MQISANKPGSAGLRQATLDRLNRMASHRFVRLGCDGSRTVVGAESDPWTSDEIEDAYDRVRELAADPARGDKITEAGLEEAGVALTAENLGVFPKLVREKTGGSEYQAPDGTKWDVKSPVSPPKDQNWYYSPHHHLDKVRKDLSSGDNIFLNLTRVTPTDRDSTLELFTQELSCDERGRLLILSDADLTN
jgi:hypothetical protein